MLSFRSSSLLQDLGYIVLSLHVAVQETCAVLHWIMVKPGKAYVLRKWLICASFREAKIYSLSIPGHSSAFQPYPTNPCLVQHVLELLHQLSPDTLSSCMDATSLQTTYLLPYYTRPHGWILRGADVAPPSLQEHGRIHLTWLTSSLQMGTAACCFLTTPQRTGPHGGILREAEVAPLSL